MRTLLLFLFLGAFSTGFTQKAAYGDGEWLKFRVHYGFLTAGNATIEVENAVVNGKETFHIKGEGKTVGFSRWFFPVEDYYESYVDKKKGIPYRFIRNINEGGHTKDIQIDFNHDTNLALVHNKKYNTKDLVKFPADAQDMVSSFYYLRNNLNIESLNEGDSVDMNMFFDKENYKFKLMFLGRETLNTVFGKVPCLIFRPYVHAGRVFKAKESLTVWVSDDENKIPILIKADLAVGSLKATLVQFKGLKNSFRIQVD